MNSSSDFIVLGGGIAGLTIAREIASAGRSVVVIEQAPEIGGLARTFRRDGFSFDLGGHRFHSNNADVVRWIEQLLEGDLLHVERHSRIRVLGRFVDYPVRLSQAITSFGPMTAVRIAASYLVAASTYRRDHPRSFEEWVKRRFGRVLHEIYFKPYTEKLWGIRCDELSADWAAQRIGLPSLSQAVYHALARVGRLPATIVPSFRYPRRGYGTIAERLADEIAAAGQVILTGTSAGRVRFADGEVEVEAAENGKAPVTLRSAQVISTIPIDRLLGALSEEPEVARLAAACRLRYRGIVLIFLAIDRCQVSGDNWTYFPGSETVFGRSHEPKNWSAAMVPRPTVTSLSLEVFASPGDPRWTASDTELIERAVSNLEAIGWTRTSEILGSWVLRVPYAYPVYSLDYLDQVQAVRRVLARWPQLSLIGRTGAFQYKNVDGIVEDCFHLAARLGIGGRGQVRPLAQDSGRWV